MSLSARWLINRGLIEVTNEGAKTGFACSSNGDVLQSRLTIIKGNKSGPGVKVMRSSPSKLHKNPNFIRYLSHRPQETPGSGAIW